MAETSRAPSSRVPSSRAGPERPRTRPEINEYRRRGLIDGTIQSMAENGVAGTTVQTICAAAGVSRGLIGHYYDSKEELVAEAFKSLFERVAEQVREQVAAQGAKTAVERLKAVPVALFSPEVFTRRNRDAFLSFWHEVRFNPLVRKANRDLYRGYIERFEGLFRDAAAERGIEIDSRRAALGLIALSDGLWLGLSIHDQVLSPRQAVDHCLLFIEERLSPPAS
jgi:TetR/AcrR family transcriptional repressor of bet genes